MTKHIDIRFHFFSCI